MLSVICICATLPEDTNQLLGKGELLDFCFSSSYFCPYPSPSCSCVSSSCGILSAVDVVCCLEWELFVTYWYSTKDKETQLLKGFIRLFVIQIQYPVLVPWLTCFDSLCCLMCGSVGTGWCKLPPHSHGKREMLHCDSEGTLQSPARQGF